MMFYEGLKSNNKADFEPSSFVRMLHKTP
jgi:hypothetical protein